MKKKDRERLDEICIDAHLQETLDNWQIARLKRIKREKQREKVLTVFIGLFIVIATCLLLYASSKLTSNAQKNCIEMGHSENYCYEKL